MFYLSLFFEKERIDLSATHNDEMVDWHPLNNVQSDDALITSKNNLRLTKVAKNCYIPKIHLFNITIKPMYNDHPRDPKFVAVVDR